MTVRHVPAAIRLVVALPIALALFVGLAPTVAIAAGEIAPTGSAAPAASGALPELPRLPPITAGEPDPGAAKDLDRLIERLTADDERARSDARAAIADVKPPWVAAIHHRLRDLRGGFDREDAARLLEAARKSARKAKHGGDAPPKKAKKEGKKDKGHADEEEADGDWLDFLLASPRPKDKAWRDLTSLLGMERMLAAVGTTPAVRELVGLYASFGELLRIDLQRQMAKLRDKAVPALIEARQHDAKIVQRWANKELDALGRAIPGEAVASNDPQILADVLRAYGRTRDVDAMRVILSYSNSERAQLRDAAREAVAAIGEPGVWQIRDQYLGLTGDKPPRAWAWDRLARELFGLYDRGRQTEINKLMDEGVAAEAAGKLTEATAAFDQVLARAPLYERRKEMVKAYQEAGKASLDRDHEGAIAVLRKAWRIDPSGPSAKALEADIAYLEGMLSIDRQTPDKTAFERALSLDPTHDRARKELAQLEDKAIERESHLRRYALAAGIGVVAIVLMLLLVRLRRSPKPPVSVDAAANG